MADGNYGERVIDIDLSVTGARTIRDATLGHQVKVTAIVISGVAGAASSPITLMKESGSGPIVFYFQPTPSASNYATANFGEGELLCKGLYLANIGTAYTSGHLLIYTR